MSHLKSGVIAAIPNYNMAPSLGRLIPQLLRQAYDKIYILDDASTDHSIAVARSFGKKVVVIEGRQNRGAGANRNRILKISDHEFSGSIIHFIDADASLESTSDTQLAKRIFTESRIGLAGGLIKLPDGTQSLFNFGPRYSLYSVLGGAYQMRFARIVQRDPAAAASYYRKRDFWLKEFPNLLEPPRKRNVFWVSEANMLVPYDVFKRLGGFDPRLRYHEIQDLAIRLERAGYRAVFDPRIVVVHPYFTVNDQFHSAVRSRAGWQLLSKYGLHLR